MVGTTSKVCEVVLFAWKPENDASVTKPEFGWLLIWISKSFGKRGPRLERKANRLTSNGAPRSTVTCSGTLVAVPAELHIVAFLVSTRFSFFFRLVSSLEASMATRPKIGALGSGTLPDRTTGGGNFVSISKRALPEKRLLIPPPLACTLHRYNLPAGSADPGVKELVLILDWLMGVPPLVMFSTTNR